MVPSPQQSGDLAQPYAVYRPVSYDPGRFWFETAEGDPYEVVFTRRQGSARHVSVSFGIRDEDDCYEVTGKGDMLRVLSTVTVTIRTYLKENSGVESVEFCGEPRLGEPTDRPTQRTRVFQRYVPHMVPIGQWKMQVIGNMVQIIKVAG